LLRVEKLWVEDVDLSAFLDNSPGDANATAAVEEKEESDKKFDGGNISDDETEDGLEGGTNSANSGGAVMAVPPLVAAVEIIDSQAGGDAAPIDGENVVFGSNEASGVLGDVDVEMSEVSVAGECSFSWSFSNSVSLYSFSSYQEGPQACGTNSSPSVGEGSSAKDKKRKE
jgi:hypothetical protein